MDIVFIWYIILIVRIKIQKLRGDYKHMKTINKINGRILYIIGKIISGVLTGIIIVSEALINLMLNIAKGFLALISMGGCLLVFLLGGSLLTNPFTIIIILSFIIIPFIGSKFVNHLKYLRYMTVEYLFDLSYFLRDGTRRQFQSLREYGEKYIRMEEEKFRKEQQRRQEQQQREWEERFRQWSEYQRSSGGFGGFGQTGYGGNQYGGQPYMDPTSEFKSKYEKSCDLLGVNYNTNSDEVKLAYRRKAKQYHPDINQSSDATKKFQEINEAYEFLGEDNIARYRNIS